MNRLEWLALLLATAAIVCQCFVPPAVGLADNGDFPKIISQFDVRNPTENDDDYKFVNFKYIADQKYHWQSHFYSSELLLFAAAFGSNSVFGSPDTFDLRVMGALHAGIFLLAFGRLLPVLRSFQPAFRLAVLALILAMFTDVMYVSYFNSFYMDTAAYLFLLLSVVSFLRALCWQKSIDRWLFVVSAVLLITSKTQHFLLGIPIALLLAWKGALLTAGRGRVFRVLSASIVLAATAFTIYLGAPANYRPQAAYNVVFSELLPASKNIADDLKELGLEDSYRRYVGSNAYSSDSAMRDRQLEVAFRKKVLLPRIAWFLIKHPSTALQVAVGRMNGAGMQRMDIGNFSRAAGLPKDAQTRSFAVWSGFKARVFGLHGGWYLLYTFALAGSVVALAIAGRINLPAGMPIAAVVLVAITLIELLVACFGDAFEPERHFSLFNALMDLLLICGICLTVSRRRRDSGVGENAQQARC